MIKHFCEICGLPANTDHVGLSFPFGEPYRAYSVSKGDGLHQPTVEMHVHFCAREIEKVENGDTADLCRDCQVKLLNQMVAKLLSK